MNKMLTFPLSNPLTHTPWGKMKHNSVSPRKASDSRSFWSTGRQQQCRQPWQISILSCVMPLTISFLAGCRSETVTVLSAALCLQQNLQSSVLPGGGGGPWRVDAGPCCSLQTHLFQKHRRPSSFPSSSDAHLLLCGTPLPHEVPQPLREPMTRGSQSLQQFPTRPCHLCLCDPSLLLYSLGRQTLNAGFLTSHSSANYYSAA